MPTQGARSEDPDERRDVLVHYTQIRTAATGEKRATWVVFLGLQNTLRAPPSTPPQRWPGHSRGSMAAGPGCTTRPATP